MVKPLLYGVQESPPVRAVLLTAESIGLDLEFRSIDVVNNEHKSEYMKKNPQHTVPLLEDAGKYIWDSHAIGTYLIGKYAKNDSLYPKDLYQRALIDQRLHFDTGVLFSAVCRCAQPIFYKGNPDVPQESIDNVCAAYDFVEHFLADNLYLVGNTLTIADFCCVATISSSEAFVPVNSEKYPNIFAWIKRLEQLPFYEEKNGKGARGLISAIHNKISELKLKK